jgi:YebC/PmpR family DNA-binding regulatory protein
MSGHSKWHNIQAKKGKADKARSNIFTKVSRLITVAAREGGGNPDMNFSLRIAIDKAKAVNMPKDNIERAIKRGTGELKDGVIIEEVIYEGFGPNGVAFLVEALTDNKNRTVSEVKNVFTRYGGSMAGVGAVKWMFARQGVVRLSKSSEPKVQSQKSSFELELIDAGAEDIVDSEFGLEIRCPVEKFQAVNDVVKKFGLETESAGLEWVAKEPVMLDDATSGKVSRLYDALDEMDDVREVYTNEA